MRDPLKLLHGRGVELPEGVELHVYIPARRRRRGGDDRPQDGPLEAHFGDIPIAPLPPAVERWWESTHEGCPYPTYPYRTKKVVEVCDMWALAVSGLEWV